MANEKIRRRQNAERQAALREKRDALGLCRTCGEPAAVSAKTGRLAKQCKRHLAMDNARKVVIPLTWSRRPARATGRLYRAMYAGSP